MVIIIHLLWKTSKLAHIVITKGNKYEVIGVARHSETMEEMVVCRALYDNAEFGENVLWVRPMEMFCETVMVDGAETPRFQFIA